MFFLSKLLQVCRKCLPLQCVFHGIRLLRLIKIGCRETINFFLSARKVMGNVVGGIAPFDLPDGHFAVTTER